LNQQQPYLSGSHARTSQEVLLTGTVLKEAGLDTFWRDGDQRIYRTRVMFEGDWNMDIEERLDGTNCG